MNTACSARSIVDGQQVEVPDNWLDIRQRVGDPAAGATRWRCTSAATLDGVTENGRHRCIVTVENYNTVEAVPYDMPAGGLRQLTWSTCLRTVERPRSPKQHRPGDVQPRPLHTAPWRSSELARGSSPRCSIPNDNTLRGQGAPPEAAVFLLLRRRCSTPSTTLRSVYGTNWSKLPEKVAIHINDTHPAIGDSGTDAHSRWTKSGWAGTRRSTSASRTLAYTNHTIMAEALEKWPEDMMREHAAAHLHRSCRR